MTRKEDEIYLDKINEVGGKVYEFYNMSARNDLIMVYEMQEDKIYSYIYKEYLLAGLRANQIHTLCAFCWTKDHISSSSMPKTSTLLPHSLLYNSLIISLTFKIHNNSLRKN